MSYITCVQTEADKRGRLCGLHIRDRPVTEYMLMMNPESRRVALLDMRTMVVYMATTEMIPWDPKGGVLQEHRYELYALIALGVRDPYTGPLVDVVAGKTL